MQELNELAHRVLAEAIAGDELATKMRAAAGKMVDAMVQEMFRDWGPLAKAIRERIELDVPQVIDVEGLAKFNALVGEIIKRRLAHLADERAAKAVDEMLTRLLGGDSTTVTLEDLCEMFAAQFEDQEAWRHEDHFTCVVEESQSQTPGWFDVMFDPEEGADRYQCLWSLRFKPAADGSGLSEAWSVSYKQNAYSTSLFTGPLFRFDAAVFQLHVGALRLQRTSFSTKYPRSECRCDD